MSRLADTESKQGQPHGVGTGAGSGGRIAEKAGPRRRALGYLVVSEVNTSRQYAGGSEAGKRSFGRLALLAQRGDRIRTGQAVPEIRHHRLPVIS